MTGGALLSAFMRSVAMRFVAARHLGARGGAAQPPMPARGADLRGAVGTDCVMRVSPPG